jgi:hypothetical protein
MIRLSYTTINNQEFVQALVQLFNTKLEAKTSYRVSRMFTQLKNTLEKCHNKEKDIILTGSFGLAKEPGCELGTKLDENGFPEVDPAKRAEFKKLFDVYMNETFIELEIHKLDFELVAQYLTPRQLNAIECVLDNLPKE